MSPLRRSSAPTNHCQQRKTLKYYRQVCEFRSRKGNYAHIADHSDSENQLFATSTSTEPARRSKPLLSNYPWNGHAEGNYYWRELYNSQKQSYPDNRSSLI
jgi:hypothetical protein